MWEVFLRYVAFRKLGAVAVEHVCLVACAFFSVHIGAGQQPVDYARTVLEALVIAVLFQGALHLRDAYDLRGKRSLLSSLFRVSQAICLASVLLLSVQHFFPRLTAYPATLERRVLLVSIFLILWQGIWNSYHTLGAPKSNLLLIGTGRLARELVGEILRHPALRLRVSGFVDDNPALVGSSIVNPKVIGVHRDLPALVDQKQVDRIVVELQDRRGRLPIEELLLLKIKGVAIEDATSLYERITGKIAIENLKPSWMIFNSGFEVSTARQLQKRILSLVVSFVLILLFSPVILIVMAMIKLNSPGPVFHRQERVGQNGHAFTIWKFRSMYEDAEQKTGPVWAKDGDSRVTPVGRLLRRTRLDELPQLLNVLRGDMSLVGPRPERPMFVRELSGIIPFYQLRHSVKPGVTGWAQINYEYGNSVRDAVEKLQYDLFYIKHTSWLLDSLIVFETAKTVLVRKGS